MATRPTGYISSKVEGRAIDGKGGHGVFALEKVRAGEILVVWGGEVITGGMLAGVRASRRRLVLQVDDGLYLVSAHEGPADWVNHSCDPNAGMRGQITLVAMRNIASGDEITFDYAMTDASPYDEFVCGCGARRCRERVTADDWRLPVLQRRYRGHFAPYIQARIESLALELQQAG